MLILLGWPAPVSGGPSPSPACLCPPCSTEIQAVGTRPAASLRCAACTVSPLTQIWTKARLKQTFSTRASSSRGFGTQRAPYSVLLLLRLLSQGPFKPTAAQELRPKHKFLTPYLTLSPNHICLATNPGKKLLRTVPAVQSAAGRVRVRGSG